MDYLDARRLLVASFHPQIAAATSAAILADHSVRYLATIRDSGASEAGSAAADAGDAVSVGDLALVGDGASGLVGAGPIGMTRGGVIPIGITRTGDLDRIGAVRGPILTTRRFSTRAMVPTAIPIRLA